MSKLEDNLELQFFMKALSYLYASDLVWKNRPQDQSLLAPSLYLICHGVELALKGNLLLQGIDLASVSKSYGHKIKDLWLALENADLREVVKNFESKMTGAETGITERIILKLARLHSGKNGKYPLRYDVSVKAEAPIPNLIVPIFVSISRMGIYQAIDNLKINRPEILEDIDVFSTKLISSYYINWIPQV